MVGRHGVCVCVRDAGGVVCVREMGRGSVEWWWCERDKRGSVGVCGRMVWV